MRKQSDSRQAIRYAGMFSALANEARVRILRLLIAAHPGGLVVGDIQSELGIPNSTLSHHLEKLKVRGLVNVRRQGSFLWHSANTGALQEILGFLYAECCTRSRVVSPESVVGPASVQIKKGEER